MPETTILLCRECGKDKDHYYHAGGMNQDGSRWDGPCPFDGVPYVRCPRGCADGAILDGHREDGDWYSDPCPSCSSSPKPGWVKQGEQG